MYLKVGSKGDDVKIMQKKIGVRADGFFGPETARSLQAWKRSKSLKDDSIVDDDTWQVLIKDEYSSGFFLSGELAVLLNKLHGVLPPEVIKQFNHPIYEAEINSPLRLAHFLAQCAHESGGFNIVTENLNYSAKRLVEVFPRYFDLESAKLYVGHPELIASKVYANRNGNGTEKSQDGYLYRGRGFIQLTGKDNYLKFFKYIEPFEGRVTNPDLVADKYPLLSAYYYFSHHGLWQQCDYGKTTDVITKITKIINGGTNGLPDRIARFSKFCDLLSI